MCGIYGSTKVYTKDVIRKKLKRIGFRGPDYSSFEVIDGRVILGHNRLSIIDLDPRSNQPFVYEGIWIVFNGEIFNFLSLKKDLTSKGYKFRTTSDTEVICAAYLCYGDDFVSSLNGMFAFVIYDAGKNKFIGARDRLGKKPLYYYFNRELFEFASQPSSIAVANDLIVSCDAMKQYLLWGYIPEPLSIFNNVLKLEAGYQFTFNVISGEFIKKQYWALDGREVNSYRGNIMEAAEELECLLKDAIKIRMIADVPLGLFLSGGIDSSLVAALSQQLSEQQVKTFSVRFNENAFDESRYAKLVARHIKSFHTVIDCNPKDGIELINDLVYYYDEPFADTSSIPSLLLAKNTRKYVKVALSGDGGDEMFLGYHSYRKLEKNRIYFTLPLYFRRLMAKGLNNIPSLRLKAISAALSSKDIYDYHIGLNTGFNMNWVNYQSNLDNAYFRFNKSSELLQSVADFDIKTYLIDDINTKVDRATMAFALESRAPLMDYRVVEFARKLPVSFKYDGDVQKKILKMILFKYVPETYFNRPKTGFQLPLGIWFRSELKEELLDVLTEKNIMELGLINFPVFNQYLNDHLLGKWNYYKIIWKVFVLLKWLNENKSA